MNELITLRKPVVNLSKGRKGSRAVILPVEWLDHWERQLGQAITEDDLTLGETITIRPVLDHNHN